jgi:tyrosine decarboxylase
VHWRRDFHPNDAPIVSASDMRDPGFEDVIDRSREVLEELTNRLKSTSTPWFSTRYLGHMNSDTLMISNLAELATILYNPNNVAYESSVATSQMETEVGEDFGRLAGYDTDTAWGHITTDGTVANYEGLWLARNLKSLPLAVRDVLPKLVAGKTEWELLNFSTADALDLLDRVKENRETFAKALQASSRGTGVGQGSLGKVLVPSTRHYSWDKAVDLLGIGISNLIKIPVDEHFRMDLTALQAVIDDLVAQHIPILALVGVVGTTEEGAIDDIAGMKALIAANRMIGTNFYFHIDAAYGGYARTMFLDETNSFMPQAQLHESLARDGFAATEWPSALVRSAFEAMDAADSITIDPHKMGYVPYAAGGITLRDRRILGLISYAAAYVFEAGDNLAESLGSVVLEGSKSGTTAAGVWAAHQLLPLNHSGYGQLIARSWAGARQFLHTLETVEDFEAGGVQVTCQPLLTDPDFNIVCFAFNVVGNTDLGRMNAFNQEIYHRFSYEFGPLYEDDWITSHTELNRSVYGDVPASFVARLGVSGAEWDRVGSAVVLRSCVLHPWIAHDTNYPERFQSFLDIITKTVGEILTTSGADFAEKVAQHA